jgi:hypothetical protein
VSATTIRGGDDATTLLHFQRMKLIRYPVAASGSHEEGNVCEIKRNGKKYIITM